MSHAEYEIISVESDDIRWPTSLQADGSDAMHSDPDYSCVYVTTKLRNGHYGNGITFTLGRGTEVVKLAVEAMIHLVIGRNANEIFKEFGIFWRTLTSDSQLRWVGPEKGVTHLAVAALINSLWDLWSKLEGKPLWRLLVDMDSTQLVSTIDFRYITDVITPEEAIQLLEKNPDRKNERIVVLQAEGYPAYTTQVGWLGYSDEKIQELCKKYLDLGFTGFKIKVGRNLKDDQRRCRLVREAIGEKNHLMLDANQVWNVDEAIDWVSCLSEFRIRWIEEPTSPDDILGHLTISRSLKPLNIGVATGEMCANRVMFKQFLQSGALQFCQIDSARIGGVNEILSVYLMAKKLNIKVCPHAGGVGLCEMVQHLQMWDYVSLSGSKTGRTIEYVDQQHDQFINPAIVQNGSYMTPKVPGYSTELRPEAIQMYSYPNGKWWQEYLKNKN